MEGGEVKSTKKSEELVTTKMEGVDCVYGVY